jgi:hypothetical protein
MTKTRKSSPIKPSKIDVAEGQRAFEAFKSEFEALRAEDLDTVRVELQLVGALTHSIAVRDLAPPRRKEFERLDRADFYDVGNIERLGKLALATWFTRQRQLGKAALATSAQVPEPVLHDGQDRKARMFRVIEHWAGDDADVATELAVIRSGTGYQDLANDLDALADLYQREDIRQLIANDKKHYRADDVVGARKTSQAIFKGLGLAQDSEAQVWTGMAQRAWTLLSRAYAEHQRCGVFLFGKSENTDESYPSLVSAVRSPARRGQAAEVVEATMPANVEPGATD